MGPGTIWGRGGPVCLQLPQGDFVTLCGCWSGRDGGERTQQEALADRTGASSRGRSVGRMAGGCRHRRQAGSGRARNRARATVELGFPRPPLWQMQGEAAGRAGEPSGQGEEASPEGLGGHDLLAQADAGCPTGQVVGHHLYRQPGGVGGEAARRAISTSPVPAAMASSSFLTCCSNTHMYK